MFTYVKKSDADLQQDVTSELKWDASISSTQINVSAKDGIVLTGDVHSLAEIEDARVAAYNAPGVYWVENKLKIAA